MKVLVSTPIFACFLLLILPETALSETEIPSNSLIACPPYELSTEQSEHSNPHEASFLEYDQSEKIYRNEEYDYTLDELGAYITKIGKYYNQGNTNSCFTVSLLNANIAAHPYIDGWPVARGKGKFFEYFINCITDKIGTSWLDGVEVGSRAMFEVLECKKKAVSWFLHRNSEMSLHLVTYGGQSLYPATLSTALITNFHNSLRTLCGEIKTALQRNDDGSDNETGAAQLFLGFPRLNPDGSIVTSPDGTPEMGSGHAAAVQDIECAPTVRITIIDSDNAGRPRYETLGADGVLQPSGLMIGGAIIENNSSPLGISVF